MMKTKSIIVAITLVISFIGSNAQNEITNVDFSELKGTYLGQKPPNKTPVFFADGVIANKFASFHTNLMFTPDRKECYWHAKLPDKTRAIVVTKLENGVWSQPVIAPFSKTEFRDDCPFISPDGKRFYFISRRPLTEGEKGGKENIWVMNRINQSWSEPQALNANINLMEGIHWQISVDKENNLYFGTCTNLYSPSRVGDIYYSKFLNGQYQHPEKLGDAINANTAYNCCPYISPNGSYLLYSREDSKTHKTRIFISHKNQDGNWTDGIDLNDVIGDNNQTCPIVTVDGKYFFFLRYVNSFCQPFWVDAKVIEDIKQKNLK